MTNVLVEGGGRVLGSFLDDGQVDAVEVFIAPILEGGSSSHCRARTRPSFDARHPSAAGHRGLPRRRGRPHPWTIAPALAHSGRLPGRLTLATLDHPEEVALQWRLTMAWILPARQYPCSMGTILRRGDSLVAEGQHEPSGVKIAPKAVVGRVSLYLRQLEAYQRQGCTTVSSSQLGAAALDQECPGPQGPGVLRSVRPSGDRLPDRRADRRPAAYPRDRPRLAAGARRPGQPGSGPAAISRVPDPRFSRGRSFRQRSPTRSVRSTTAWWSSRSIRLRKVVALRKINLAILCVPAESPSAWRTCWWPAEFAASSISPRCRSSSRRTSISCPST